MFYSRNALRATVAAAVVFVLGGVASAQAQEGLPAEAVGMMQIDEVSGPILRAAQTSIAGPDGIGKDGPLAAVGMELALLYHQHEAAGPEAVQAIRRASTRRPTPKSKSRTRRGQARGRLHSPISANGQFVTVEAIASGTPSQLLRELRALGLEGGTTAGNVVSGRLPIAAIKEAADLGALRGMMPSYARTLVGDAGSEADTAHAAYKAREAKGVNGSGQKICAMSDSYNQSSSASTSPSEDIQSGDLPGSGNPDGRTTPVDVVQDSDTDESDEGRAMLQLIHDIAPGASLGFHTAFGGLAVFASGIRDLADAGCTIIVDDVRYSAEPFYQDGPVSNAVDDVVNNDGIPYFSSAGNSGQDSYEAPFRNSGESGVINSSSVAHDFDPSSRVDTRQEVTIQPGATFQLFSFQWTDPSALVQGSAGADTDLDVALVDGNDNIQAQSSRDNIATGVPVEFLEYTNDTDSEQTLYLVIEKAAGPDPEEVKYVYSGDDFDIREHDTLGPTLYGHPMAKGAMAVAAAPFYNTERYNPNSDPAALEPFSSKGGIPILFRQDGTRYLQPRTRKKPEVTGTDGIDNTFFGFDLSDTFFNGIDGDSDPNFFGTSAAAPNVAAIAALIKQARPGFTPTEVYSRLEDTAEDVTTRQNRSGSFVSIASGRDPWSGHGFVQALDAVPTPIVANLRATTVDATAGQVKLSWDVGGSASIEEYEVERRYFNGPFEVVARPNGPSVTLDSLGLGVFAFRVHWVRSDGTEGTSAAVVDTLGIQALSTDVVGQDEKKRRTVEISWSVPEGTRNFTYQIERQTGDEGPFVEIGSTTGTTFEAERQVPGTYNYRVTSVDEQGNSLTSSPVRRQIDFEGAAFAVGPYPNPTGTRASLDLTAQTGQTVTVELFNMLGKRVYRTERRLEARTPVTLSIDVSRWSSGMYFLRVRGKEFTKTRKMIVVK